MIVIEGPDGAGKSTLCIGLSKVTGVVMSGESRLPQEARNTVLQGRESIRPRVYEALASAVRGFAPPVIHDRLYFSELVYGQVVRGEVTFSSYEQQMIERMYKALQCPIIICLPPYKLAYNNVRQKPQMKGVLEMYTEIYRYYESLSMTLRMRGLNVHVWDYTNHKWKPQDVIETYLGDRKEREWQ